MGELPGAGYFYTLAQLGLAFSGFAALLMAIRQMNGMSLSKFHLFVAKSYVQSGLVTAISAMFSPLLFALGLSLDHTWQTASAAIGFPALVMIAIAPMQWRRATDMPLQTRLKIHLGLGILINIALLINASGAVWKPNGGMVMLAASWNLFAFFLQFPESLRFFYDETKD